MELYCANCKKKYLVNVLISTNSWMIKSDPELSKKAKEGTLFKNFCPKCNNELVNVS